MSVRPLEPSRTCPDYTQNIKKMGACPLNDEVRPRVAQEASDKVPAFSIGAVYGDYDAESKAWDPVIRGVMKEVKGLCDGITTPLKVNVVFYIDGKLARNEFSGVRTGRFSKRDSELMVQAAVPNGPVDDRRKQLRQLLTDAIDEAEVFAQKKKIASDLTEIRRILNNL